ncbi:PAS domain-containing protein [Bradyrhizobium sp. F1.13.1]
MAAALVAKEGDFRLIAEQCSDVVMRIGLDERIVYASPSRARILAWDPARLLGTPLSRASIPRTGRAWSRSSRH